MAITVRDATRDDAEAIAAFNSSMVIQTEGRSLDESIIRPGVARLINDDSKGRYWVAEESGKVVGQIRVTYEWSDWRNGTISWIQSVYVDVAHRRQGVFSSLQACGITGRSRS